MLFNVPPRIKYCAMGAPFRLAMLFTDACVQPAHLLIHWACPSSGPPWQRRPRSALLVYWSRCLLAPRPVFSVASIIPMIPGSYAFKTMIAIVELNISG